jgi:hypothetical protein
MRWLLLLGSIVVIGALLPGLFGCAAPLGTLGPPPVVRTADDPEIVGQAGVSAGGNRDATSTGARLGMMAALSDHFALGVTLHYVGLYDREGGALHSLLYTGELLFFGEHAGFRLSLGLLGGGGPAGPAAAYGLAGGQVFGHVGRWRIYGGGHATIMTVLSRRTVDSTALQGVVGVELMVFEEPWLRVGLGAELQGGRRRFGGTDALDTRDHFVGALGNLTVYLGDAEGS